MRLHIVETRAIQEPITESPGFAKKGLSEYKLDLCGLCGFGCRYCSSNDGNYQRINRVRFADAAEQQLGERLTPNDDPGLMHVWPDVLEKLDAQLARKDKSWGQGQTLVFSMLTDGFSPYLLRHGITTEALRMVLARTSFRIRILTKNAIVGSAKWVDFFRQHRDRFVVGLSSGTLDDRWAKRVEIGTSSPTARLRAMRRLREAGIPTYGMLCPTFPDVLADQQLEQLVDAIDPAAVEHVWAEPYNDRKNWQQVRDGYEPGSAGYEWFTEAYERKRSDLWSRYATDLYIRLRAKARAEGWLDKLRYLLYEDRIARADAERMRGLDGVWLQSKPYDDGRSRNRWVAALQAAA